MVNLCLSSGNASRMGACSDRLLILPMLSVNADSAGMMFVSALAVVNKMEDMCLPLDSFLEAKRYKSRCIYQRKWHHTSKTLCSPDMFGLLTTLVLVATAVCHGA